MAYRESEPHRTSTSNNLLAAATEGNKDALLSSLDAGAAVDEMDSSCMTPLMHAAENGHLDCLLLLIGRGADVDKRSGSGLTAAHYAAIAGNSEVLLALFDAGVSVDVTDSYNQRTPLMFACLKGHTQCVLSLLRQNADAGRRSIGGLTAAHCAAFAGSSEALLAVLDAGVAVDVTDSNLMTPLLCAASRARLECVLLLMQRGADVRHQSADGGTAAHHAAERGNVEMLRVLIASGADLLPLARGLSIVDSACISSQMDAASFALACGCRFSQRSEKAPNIFFIGFKRSFCGLSAVNCTL